MLRFADLQDSLRALLWSQIEAGELTGTELASASGFRQAHISNFLNRKRGLSLEGLDRILTADELSVLDLIPPGQLTHSHHSSAEAGYEDVLLVRNTHLAHPLIQPREVVDVHRFRKTLLRRFHTDTIGDRKSWVRFLLMRPSRSCAEFMYPRFSAGATLLIDRHYNSLNPYRRKMKSLYAVRANDDIVIRYVEAQDNLLILSGESRRAKSFIVRPRQGTRPEEVILGRVAYISTEP